jgi:hypothetical protein
MESLEDGFAVAARTKINIRTHAAHGRKVLKVGPGRIDIPRLLDRLSVEYGIHYDIIEDHSNFLPPGVEACYVPENSALYIRASVFDEMCTGGKRAVFTLGHELGHIILGHKRTINRFAPNARIEVYCNSEWQANRFAAEFTMPLELINEERLFTVESLVRRFGVSEKAAGVRIADLERDRLLQRGRA